MKGFFNKMLRIHLKTRTFQEEILPDSVLETTLGGKGLGTHLLMRENPPGVDPLSPENRLVFCTGPITNTRDLWLLQARCLYEIASDRDLLGVLLWRQGRRTDEPDRV